MTKLAVVVMGATAEEPPPGIGVVAEVVDLRFAATVEEVAAALEGAEVLFAWRAERDLLAEAWSRATDLRWIQSASTGVDALLFPELVRSEVVVTNAGGVFDDAMAEYVLGLMLLFAKDLIGILDRQRRREWLHRETERLAGRRLLVAGVGPIGRAIARAAGRTGMEVRGVGRTSRGGGALFGVVHGSDELLDALPWPDYVVDVLPATEETFHLFDERAFGAMQPWTRFINVGRGSTVDQSALVAALEEGRIGAAALDVFEDEPLPDDSPLWGMPNVVVSPHMSGDFGGWKEAVVELFVDNLRRHVSGERLRNVVDKRLGYPAGS